MSYLTQSEIAFNESMSNRVTQGAVTEGRPEQWAYNTRRQWASAPGWDDAWESARVAHPEEDYDPGADEAVITDGMILSQIQSMEEV